MLNHWLLFERRILQCSKKNQGEMALLSRREGVWRLPVPVFTVIQVFD
jgi:hypothetical protein